MATPIINQTLTTGRQRNTGVAKQGYNPKYHRSGYFLPKGDRLTAAQLADLQATLISKTTDPIYAKRWQALPIFNQPEGAGEDAQRQTLSTGDSFKTRDQIIGWKYTIWGNLDTLTALRAFEDKADALDFMPYDSGNVLQGEDVVGTNGGDTLGGLDILSISVDAMDAMPDSRFAIILTITLADATQWLDRRGFFQAPFNIPNKIPGVVDIHLNNRTNTATGGIVQIAPMAGSSNLIDVFPTQLVQSNGTAAFKAYVKSTGAPVTITAASIAPGLGVNLTLNIGSLTSGTVVVVTMQDMATLSALGIVNFESDTVEITVP